MPFIVDTVVLLLSVCHCSQAIDGTELFVAVELGSHTDHV